VLIASKCDFDKNPKANDERRAIIRKSYENAIASGDKNVYFLDGEWMFGNTNRDSCTVDGCHPNDLGFMRMAETFTPVIDDILNG
jgi:lysophospholipase L1-like esterase